MDTSGRRLKYFLNKEDIEQKRLASILGKTPQYVNGVCSDRTTIGKKLANTLQETIGVSAAWLLTGTGSMYADRQEDDGMAHDDVPEYEELPRTSLSVGRPYYNVDFALGFGIMENDQTRTPDYLIDFPPYNDCDCYCNAHGNSMYPTIASGDIVALKHITDISVLINGDIYAIVTTNGLRTIKRIRDNGTTVTLIADNAAVAEQTIDKSIIRHVFHVRGTIKTF